MAGDSVSGVGASLSISFQMPTCGSTVPARCDSLDLKPIFVKKC